MQINISIKGSNTNKIINEGAEAALMAGSVSHKIKVDSIPDANTAYLTVDGGASTEISVHEEKIINGIRTHINSITYGVGTNNVGVSIAESGINVVLNWDGVNETNDFAYHGTFWNAS